MSKVLFVNGNVHGHINPTISLVKELTSRGEEVCYFSTAEFKEKIEKTGAEFIDYGSMLHQFYNSFRPGGSHPFYTLIDFLLGMDRVVVPLVMEKTKGRTFDYMIHDAMFGGGNVLANTLGLPAICSCTSFAMNKLPIPDHMCQPGFHPQLDNIYNELKVAAKDWNMETLNLSDIFFKRENLNLVFTSRLFQPEEGSFDDSFKFIGPSISERDEKIEFPYDELAGHKVIYISMGTINNSCAEFYGKCMEAFAGENFKVVMSIGTKVDIAALGKIPPNFIIRNYVPQLDILKVADAFISHGGLNSVSEALYYDVPVVAIPLANDQSSVASRLVTLGAGIGLKMNEITTELLKDSVHKIFDDGSYKSACQRIRTSFVEAGGYKAAADWIFKEKYKHIC